MYSLACVLWEIVTGFVPYADLEEKIKDVRACDASIHTMMRK